MTDSLSKMSKVRLGVIGCGFWSRYQTAAWLALDDVDLVAVCDQNLARAEEFAQAMNIRASYADSARMLEHEDLDVVDVITDPDSHEMLVKMAADYGVAVICQKPMAPTLAAASHMHAYCLERGVPFFIHENFRWQQPIRACWEELRSGIIGRPFKANLKFCSSFPVFENQPLLAELEEFILTDVGTHILDLARFLFGDAKSLYCQTHSINPKIKGEDVANVFLTHENGVHCYAEMSYASRLKDERFPETFVLIEGTEGSIYLGPDANLHTTTAAGTKSKKIAVTAFEWAHPDYALAHASIYYCHQNILSDLLGDGSAETTASDNLKTLQLVFDAYQSAKNNSIIHYR